MLPMPCHPLRCMMIAKLMPFLGAVIASQKLTSADELGLALVRPDEQLGGRCESIQAREIPPRHTDISGYGSGLGRTRIANVVPVPADYGKIRDENIARYGWDTAVLDLLGQLYSERTHFIFELIQNAEDAGATELAFELFGDRLEVRHDGRPFTEADVRGVCGVGQSAKSGDLTKIGQFGIGFKSVYAYTRTPRVHSGGEHFRIDMYVRPSAVDPPGEGGEDGGRTLFVFPFDHGTVSAAVAVREIAAALTTIAPGTLLFLTSIRRLSVSGAGVTRSVIERTTRPRTATSRHVTLSTGRTLSSGRGRRGGVDRLAAGRSGPRPGRPWGQRRP